MSEQLNSASTMKATEQVTANRFAVPSGSSSVPVDFPLYLLSDIATQGRACSENRTSDAGSLIQGVPPSYAGGDSWPLGITRRFESFVTSSMLNGASLRRGSVTLFALLGGLLSLPHLATLILGSWPSLKSWASRIASGSISNSVSTNSTALSRTPTRNSLSVPGELFQEKPFLRNQCVARRKRRAFFGLRSATGYLWRLRGWA